MYSKSTSTFNINNLPKEYNFHHNVAFIGGGNMAKAIIHALITTDFMPKSNIYISVRSHESCIGWKEDGFENCFNSNEEMFTLSNTSFKLVFICVKPQMYPSLLTQLNKNYFISTEGIVSVMAGITLEQLYEDFVSLNYHKSIIRIMPNVACQISKGVTILTCDDANTDPLIKDTTKCIAKCMGDCHEISEDLFDTAGALIGCSPAYIFTVIDALADGAVKNGLPRHLALKMAAQAIAGSADMVNLLETHPSVLKDKVCSPGGTTIAGIALLEKNSVRSSFIEALTASIDRSKLLGKK
uniref:Pyrroline-5-carboxylate reductase n=1 Tax=Parastrongyloides trichosuri TaxID=131310 RepID=A0A0N4ZMA6_PARTI